MRWLLRLHDGLTELSFWGATVSVAYLTVVTAWEVFGRYALQAPSDWAPDTAAVSFAMITFLAAPKLTRDSGHARMTFLAEKASPEASLWLNRVVLFVGVLACALCAWYGTQEAVRQVTHNVKMIAVTPIPKWVVTGVIAYSLTSMALYFLRQLASTFEFKPQRRG